MAIELPLGEIYSKTLTNAAWQKKKSFLDKAKKNTKTGLGAELIKLEAAWRKTDWKVMDARMQGKWHSLEELHEGKKKAQRYQQQNLTALYNVVVSTQRKARATAQIAGLSSTAKATATSIANELEQIRRGMMSVTYEDFDEEEKRMRAGWERWRARLPKNISDLEAKLKLVEKDPRTAYWDEIDLTNAFRAVGNSLGNNPEFKDLWPDPWEKFDGLQNHRHPALKNLKNPTKVATPEEREAILELINEVRPHIAQLKKRL